MTNLARIRDIPSVHWVRLATPESRTEPVEPGAFEMEARAGVREHTGELAAGVGAANRDRAIGTRDAAGMDETIQLCEPVVQRAALEIVDDQGDARNPSRFRQIAHDLRWLEMVQKEAAGDD